MEVEIWRVFDIEAGDFRELATHDAWTAKAPADFKGNRDTWNDTLVRLSREGRLDRQRLLDASLSALARDPHVQQAGWFCRFHEALEPTLPERLKRQEKYIALFGSRNAPSITFASDALLIIEKEKKLDTKSVLAAIGPALWSAKKGAVESALRLLGRIAESNPKLREDVAITSLEALQHEKPEVHKAVLKLVEKHMPTPTLRLAEALRAKIDVVASSLRSRLSALLKDTKDAGEPKPPLQKRPPAEAKELLGRAERIDKKWASLAGIEPALAAVHGKADSIAAIQFDPMEIPHLDPERVLKPITELDELIDAFAHVIEDPGDPMEVECVLDGVSRLCAQKPGDFAVRTGPLCKRAASRDYRGPFVGAGLLPDLCGLAFGWITGNVMPATPAERNLDDPAYQAYAHNPRNSWDFFVVSKQSTIRSFLSNRLFALAKRAAAGQARQLLSAPTHAGGWIDPVELLRRHQAMPPGTDIYDQMLALLRLAPDNRSMALGAAGSVEGEWGQALRYALGSTSESIGPTAPLSVAAARARSPRNDDPLVEARHPRLGPDAGLAARYAWAVKPNVLEPIQITVDAQPKKETSAELPTVLLNKIKLGTRYGWDAFDQVDGANIRWFPTIWPIQKRSTSAVGSGMIGRNLDWFQRLWGSKTYFEPLLDHDVPLEEMGYLLLALGLAAKEPGEHGLATDALIAAIDDGRVDAEGLGGVMARLLPTGLIKAARWAKTLGQAARISPLHSWTVAGAIQRSLRDDPTQAPRDLSALLELLRELLAELEQPLTDSAARAYLEKLKAGGKTGRIVRDLLASSGNPANSAILQAAALRALEHRIERAERWQGWSRPH